MSSCNQMSRYPMSEMSRSQMGGCRRQSGSSTVSQPNPHDSMTQMQLWNHINEISFAVNDILLYLDTHPTDCDALAFAREKVRMRNQAKEAYARRFGPLTVDCTAEIDSNHWQWIMQPWPWEPTPKGGC